MQKKVATRFKQTVYLQSVASQNGKEVNRRLRRVPRRQDFEKS